MVKVFLDKIINSSHRLTKFQFDELNVVHFKSFIVLMSPLKFN